MIASASLIQPWTVTETGSNRSAYSTSVFSQGRMQSLTIARTRDKKVELKLGGTTVTILRNGTMEVIPERGKRPQNFESWKGKEKFLHSFSTVQVASLLTNLPGFWSAFRGMRPLLESIRQFKINRAEPITQAGRLPAAFPEYPVAPFGQVHAFPLDIENLNAEDRLTKLTARIKDTATRQYINAKVYRATDEEGEVTYKICVPGRNRQSDRVIGFMTLDAYDKTEGGNIHIPLMGNISPRYTEIGSALEAIAVKHMVEVGAEGIEMQTSWGAALSHVLFNLKATISPAKYAESAQALESMLIASLTDKNVEESLKQYGSILMHLPKDTIEQWEKEKNTGIVLSAEKMKEATESKPVKIGTADIKDKHNDLKTVDIYARKSAQMDVVDLVSNGETIATMTLNSYTLTPDGAELMDSQGNRFPAWCPMARYGKDVNLPHLFMEFCDMKTDRFSGARLDKALTRIAFDLSCAFGFEGRVKIEADLEWKEGKPSWKAGYRVTHNGVKKHKGIVDPRDPRANAKRLAEYVLKATLEGRADLLRILGSFQLTTTAADAIEAHNAYARRVGAAETQLAA